MYSLFLPYKPSLATLIVWHLFHDTLMRAFADGLRQGSETHDRLVQENATLRAQIPVRGQGGKLTPKTPQK